MPPPEETKPIRDSATVVVVRERTETFEVLMLRRHARSGFAAHAWVFPGGTVDDADGYLDESRWRGIDPEALAVRFRDTPAGVLAAHVAAVRETFEEAGLLFARHEDGSAVDLSAPEVAEMRAALADREQVADFHAWLDERALVLDLDVLTYWSRWITPPLESKRFDTRFFLARVPDGQVAAHDEVEITGQRWITPQAALDAHAAGEFTLIYPTIKNLEEMAALPTADRLVAYAAQRPRVDAVLPHIEFTDDGDVAVLHPDHPDYPRHLYAAELDGLPG
jgi:8-oxo-dGTP pyrophosphatase MutT (NUDIX family)